MDSLLSASQGTPLLLPFVANGRRLEDLLASCRFMKKRVNDFCPMFKKLHKKNVKPLYNRQIHPV